MITIKFANNKILPLISPVLSSRDNLEGEQRDGFLFSVAIKEIVFDELTKLILDPENTKEIILTNDEYDEPISESYVGYTDVISIKWKRRHIQEPLLNQPAVYEWVYEVYLAERTNSQKQLSTITSLLSSVPDKEANKYTDAFPMWSSMGQWDGQQYTGKFDLGYRCRYAELLYKCIQAHSIDPRQLDWNPADAASLWARISDPSIEWPEWIQPTGAHDSYVQGSKVSHKGRRWISTFGGANSWEPGGIGIGSNIWEEVV